MIDDIRKAYVDDRANLIQVNDQMVKHHAKMKCKNLNEIKQ